MKQLAEVAATSIAQAPTKHVTAMAITSAGVANGNDHSLGFLPDWLPIGDVAVVVGILVGVMTLVKTYNEIRLIRMNIKKAKEKTPE